MNFWDEQEYNNAIIRKYMDRMTLFFMCNKDVHYNFICKYNII